MENIGKRQIEILKNEYRELREKVAEECRESQQRQEVVDEVDGIMNSFVSKLEEGSFTDSEIDSYIETMGVVFRKDNNIDEDEEDYGEGTEDVQEILGDINEMMVSIFKAYFYSKLMCIFFQLKKLAVDDMVKDANEKGDTGDRNVEDFDEQYKKAMSEIDPDTGCTKTDAERLESLMGVHFERFDVLLGRKE